MRNFHTRNASSLRTEEVCKVNKLAQNSNLNRVYNAVYSSPMSTLIQSLSEMKEHFQSQVNFYDPLVTGLMGCPELVDNLADQQDSMDILPDEISRPILISDESAQTLYSGFVQTMAIGKSNVLSLSDSLGDVYFIKAPDFDVNSSPTGQVIGPLVMMTDSGEENFLFHTSEGWRINTILLTHDYSYSATVVSSIQSALIELWTLVVRNNQWRGRSLYSMANYLCLGVVGSSQPTVYDAIFEIARFLNLVDDSQSYSIGELLFLVLDHYKTNAGDRSPVSFLFSNLLDNVEVNAAFLDACTNLCVSKPRDVISSLQTKYADKKKAAKYVVQQIADAYRSGGFRGVFNYILSYIKGGATIQDEDGKLVFTDNSGLLPSEFLAGIVSTVISALAAVVAVILSIFGKILGVVLSLLSNVFMGVVNSITSTHDDVYASINSSTELERTVLPVTPFIVMKGSASQDSWFFDLLKRVYDSDPNCGYAYVPGACIFYGPGEFDDDGKVIRFNYEVHPLSRCYDLSTSDHSAYTNYMLGKYVNSDYPDVSHWYLYFNFLKIRTKQQVMNDWKYIIEHDLLPLYMPANQSNGHLSAQDDLKLRGSIAVNVGWFLLWLFAEGEQSVATGAVSDADWAHVIFFTDDDHQSSQFTYDFCLRMCMLGAFSEETDPQLSWTELILGFNEATSIVIDSSDICPKLVASHQNVAYFNFKYSDAVTDSHSQVAELSFPLDLLYSDDFEESMWYLSTFTSNFNALPNEFYYDVIVPKYNETTYWLWVGLAAAVVATVAVTAVVTTFKVKNAITKRRAINKRNFDKASTDFNNALNGDRVVEEYNEQTGEWESKTIHVDPKSAEGKTLIKNSWKSYKRTARSNNLWQRLIGGSRYDVGSFWGEASDSEMTFADKLSDFFNSEESYDDIRSVSQASIEDVTTSECGLIRQKLTDDTTRTLSSLSSIDDKLSAVSHDLADLIGQNDQILETKLNRVKNTVDDILVSIRGSAA